MITQKDVFSSETNVFPNPRLLLSSAGGREMGTNRGEELVKQVLQEGSESGILFWPEEVGDAC